MSSEGAKSVSSSIKKGFSAPLIKKDEVGEITNNQTYEKKVEPKKKSDSGREKTTNQTSDKKREKKTKPQASLTDSQYEDIFQSVLQDSTSQNNTTGENMLKIDHDKTENTPSCNEQENTPLCNEQENTPAYNIKAGLKRPVPEGDLIQTPPPLKRSKSQSEASPWATHFSKQLSQASSIIKDMVESQSSLMNSSALLSPETSSGDGEDDEECGQWSQRSCQLSQKSFSGCGSQPRTDKAPEDQRSRLENLQSLRNVGLWVFCCRPSCQKQRYLADVTDPQDVPEIWYCHMNPDEKYNNCTKPEQTLSAEEEADMIYNEFTAGSVVWARVQGYPWWPAMVDDDPDLEQFYWLEEDDVTVTHYHVVFFDEVEVTRAWVALKDISSFSKNENKYKQKSVRGVDFSRRLRVSREQAKAALALSTTQRLSAYSFIARYKGHISTSAKKVEDTINAYKLKSASKITKKKECTDQTPKKGIEKKLSVTKTKDIKRDNKIKPAEKPNIDPKIKTTKRNNKKKDEEKTANGRKKHVGKVEENQLTMKKSRPKKSKVEQIENIEKKIEKVEDCQLSGETDVKNKNHKTTKFEKYTMKKSEKSVKTNAKKASKECQKNSNDIEITTFNPEEDNKRVIDEKLVSNEPIDEINEQNPSSDQPNTNIVAENDLNKSQQTNLPGEKGPQVKLSMLNGEEEPRVDDSTTMFDSETPSHIDENFSQKSKSCDIMANPPDVPEVEDTLGSLIEPTEDFGVAPSNFQVFSPDSNSQSTIANYLAHESEDAVVPDDAICNLSQPFEE